MALSKCQRDMEEYGPNPSLQALGEGNPFLQILAGVKSMGAYATCLSAGIQKDGPKGLAPSTAGLRGFDGPGKTLHKTSAMCPIV